MKKKLIVLLVILIIIALIGLGGYLAYINYKKQDPFELEWVVTYYNYMRENHESLKVNQNGLKYYRESEKIEFCEVANISNPVMLYNYKELGVTFTNIFYISDDNQVKMLTTSKKKFTVEYLYDVENKSYDYYIHESYDDKDNYTKISDSINAAQEQNETEATEKTETNTNMLTFGKDEKNSVTTVDGDVIEISTFDEKIIKTDVVDDNWTDIDFDNYEDAVKEDYRTAFKKMEKILTDDIENEVTEKEEEINAKKEEMANAIEEIERKQKEEEEARLKAEEEAKKAAEEEAQKQAEEEAKKQAEEEAKRQEEQQNQQQSSSEQQSNSGSYTLSYGTYKGTDYWTEGDPLSKYETTIVLKEDGTYTQKNISTTTQNAVQTYSGTFTISNVQGVGLYITFSANDGAYQITGNNQFTSTNGAVIKYQGN